MKTATNFKRAAWDLLAVLLLLCVFAGGALLSAANGAKVYRQVQQETAATADLRIPLSYVASQVRQHDQAGAIKVETQEGRSVLVLADQASATETWIYTLDDGMYELCADQGADFALAAGVQVLAGVTVSFELQDGLLVTTATNQEGNSQQLKLAQRSAQATGEGGLQQ